MLPLKQASIIVDRYCRNKKLTIRDDSSEDPGLAMGVQQWVLGGGRAATRGL
jgi:hypothetical protein